MLITEMVISDSEQHELMLIIALLMNLVIEIFLFQRGNS
jgi:hypothetical protein